MPRKELPLLMRDLEFFLTGKCDVKRAAWESDEWLYPLDWSFQLDRWHRYFTPFDENGVPMRELGAQIERSYLPSRIAAYALSNWNRLRSASDHALCRARFCSCADWFAKQEAGAYRHRFSVAGMEPGWLSCIAQGEGISTLVRAHRLTGESHFASAARDALQYFTLPVSEGGVLDELPCGQPFLEEYPGSPYAHVLNGCLYAVVGIHDYVRAGLDSDGDWSKLRDAIVDSIDSNIASWEIGNWTTYDFQAKAPNDENRLANPNTLTYQTLHWILLEYLGQETGREALVQVASRWRKASESFLNRLSAFAGKVRYRFGHGY